MALNNQPYLPLYVKDFLSDEKLRQCDAESYGVYICLLCLLHQAPEYGQLVLQPRQLKSKDMIENFAYVLLRLLPFDLDELMHGLSQLVTEGVIILDGSTLYQRRMVRDGEVSKKRAVAGKNGVLAREENKICISKTSSKPSSKTEAKAKQITEIEIENEIENENNRKISEAVLLESRFDDFWRAYPKKSAKGAARKAWMKIKPSEELLDRMLVAIDVAKESEQWRKNHGEFIPFPATWLNQERWEDGDAEDAVVDDEDPYAEWGLALDE